MDPISLVGGFLVKLLGSGIVSPVLSYLEKRSDSAVLTNGQNVTGDVTIAQAQLQAYIEERKVIAQERAALRGSLWTAWMIPCAFAACLLHFGCLIIVSTFPNFWFTEGWTVAALPGNYPALETAIFMSVIGINSIPAVVRKVFSK